MAGSARNSWWPSCLSQDITSVSGGAATPMSTLQDGVIYFIAICIHYLLWIFFFFLFLIKNGCFYSKTLLFLSWNPECKYSIQWIFNHWYSNRNHLIWSSTYIKNDFLREVQLYPFFFFFKYLENFFLKHRIPSRVWFLWSVIDFSAP